MHNDPATIDPELRGSPRGRAGGSFVLTVLVHPDPSRIGEQAALDLTASDGSIHRAFPPFCRPGGVSRPLESRHVSRQPLLVLHAPDGLILRAGGERPVLVDGVNAAEHRVAADRIAGGVVLELSQRVVVLVRLGEPCPEPEGLGLTGLSPALQAVREDIRRSGTSHHPVLIRGETGVGKERVAAALHRTSPRMREPFVAVNCAAIPVATAASQLFGHARGAFTGSVGPHAGYFGQADGGTLFLDEIGEMSIDTQSLLLRALESGEAQPVGGQLRKVDLRFLSATDAPLERRVAEGSFRSALFHRLGAIAIDVPPLRSRPEDMVMQLVAFLHEELAGAATLLTRGDDERKPWLGANVLLACLRYSWPGNTRELRSVARWIALHGAGSLHAPVPPGLEVPAAETIGGSAPSTPATQPVSRAVPSPVSEASRIQAALAAADHKVEVAARALGLSRHTLRGRMRVLGLRRASELERADVAEARAAVGEDVAAMAAHLGVGEHALKLRIGELTGR